MTIIRKKFEGINKYTLKDFYIGNNDGKKEALYKADFEKYFYDYNRIYETAMFKEKFLILGRKGTGKSLLAEFIYKQSQKDSNWFCQICSYKEFKFHELILLKNDDITPNEYISIWEWVILLELGKLCLNDNYIPFSETKEKLEKFITNNFFSLDLNAAKIIEITKTNKIKGSLFKISGEHGREGKYVNGSYLNYIEDLADSVFSLIQYTQSKFTIIYDELDDKFRNDEIYKNCIISLLKAVDKINLKLLRINVDAKIIVLLRSDIFSILNDPDLNKIKIDNAFEIDWGHKADRYSPLFDLVICKIKKSVPQLENFDRDELFYLLFPQRINTIEPARYILERTFFRPRDIITYLNLIIEKYQNSTYFGLKGFIELESDYSEYFLQEIRNELSGHINDIQIDEALVLLKQFNKHHFNYNDIKDYYEKNKSIYSNINLDEVLTIFFKFSIIGNTWINEYKNKPYYSWSYRDNRATIDFDKKFTIHLGLRRALSM